MAYLIIPALLLALAPSKPHRSGYPSRKRSRLGIPDLSAELSRHDVPHLSDKLIIDETNEVVVVLKPPGIAVHDGVDSLLALLSRTGHRTLKPVHRLDIDTSGVILMAKSQSSAAKLQKALAEDTTSKKYIGILRGHPQPEEGRWTQDISRRAEGRRNPQGRASERRPAMTNYCVLCHSHTAHLSLAELTLSNSGRTHQIRRHAAVNGHALAGDERYGEKRHAAHMLRTYGLSGVLLHASSIELCVDGKSHLYEAPLPPTWSTLLADLGAGNEDLSWPLTADHR